MTLVDGAGEEVGRGLVVVVATVVEATCVAASVAVVSIEVVETLESADDAVVEKGEDDKEHPTADSGSNKQSANAPGFKSKRISHTFLSFIA